MLVFHEKEKKLTMVFVLLVPQHPFFIVPLSYKASVNHWLASFNVLVINSVFTLFLKKLLGVNITQNEII